jgi:hypothetical protein
MRNLLLFTICILASIQVAIAQDISPILYSLNGKAKYLPDDGSKSFLLSPGDELPLEGRLKFKKNTTLGIYYDYGYTYLNEAGTLALAPLMTSSNLTESDIAETLGNQLIEALHPYYQTIKATPSGFGDTGTGPVRPPQGGVVGGHGDRGIQLVRISPLGGKVTGNSITFSWEAKAEFAAVTNFTITLTDESGKTIHQEAVTGTSITMDVTTLGLQENKTYKWKVNASKDESISSGEISFEYVSAKELNNLIKTIQSDDCWIGASASAQLLIEAAVLEENDFRTNAESKFAEAYQTYNNNPLAETLYKAFLWRYDLIK